MSSPCLQLGKVVRVILFAKGGTAHPQRPRFLRLSMLAMILFERPWLRNSSDCNPSTAIMRLGVLPVLPCLGVRDDQCLVDEQLAAFDGEAANGHADDANPSQMRQQQGIQPLRPHTSHHCWFWCALQHVAINCFQSSKQHSPGCRLVLQDLSPQEE